MNYTDIKDLSVKELAKKKSTLAEEMFQAKMKNSLGQLGNPMEIRKLRKDLARINTALTAQTRK